MMNETAKKYISLFRQVKIAVTAHCLQCGRCVEFCPVNAVDRLHP